VLLALRLLLAPAFVVGTSLLARRHGPRIGGMVGGLPVVGAPVLLVITLDHGEAFGADASRATLVGLLALAAFVLAYGHACQRFRPLPTLLLGWLAFLAVDVALSGPDVPALAALVAACLWFAVVTVLLPDVPAGTEVHPIRSRWDLPVRAAAAATLVVLVSTLSEHLGPKWSGLLAPFPIIATVLAVFTHAQHGVRDTILVLRGLMSGYYAYALFAFVLAVWLPSLGTGGAFAMAVAASLALQLLVVRASRP
ncbi:MAG: hypothetical protein M3Z03_03800, partial [Actinomycetota bacterium]|nr:hypothetical protein [Actinomycetota bacterium]